MSVKLSRMQRPWGQRPHSNLQAHPLPVSAQHVQFPSGEVREAVLVSAARKASNASDSTGQG